MNLQHLVACLSLDEKMELKDLLDNLTINIYGMTFSTSSHILKHIFSPDLYNVFTQNPELQHYQLEYIRISTFLSNKGNNKLYEELEKHLKPFMPEGKILGEITVEQVCYDHSNRPLISRRLENILFVRTNWRHEDKKLKDITEDEFFAIRHAGKKTWLELQTLLREEYFYS